MQVDQETQKTLRASPILAAVMALVGAGMQALAPGGRVNMVVDPEHSRAMRWRTHWHHKALAGKPWKRGGRLTIRQRRALAFAVRRM